jgi:hypothetical protein
MQSIWTELQIQATRMLHIPSFISLRIHKNIDHMSIIDRNIYIQSLSHHYRR